MSTGLATLLSVHLLATAAMVGLIWFVQVVHYPLFAAVGVDGFTDYERQHTRLTGYVVGPPMLTEGITTLLVFFAPGPDLGRLLPTISGLLLAVALGSTILLQVPLHGSLSERFDAEEARRLVTTNWIRTAAWSARGVLAVVMIVLANQG